MLYGEVVGKFFLLSPAVTALGVGFYASNMPAMRVTVWVAHLFYGAILGWLCQCWVRDRGWLFSRTALAASEPLKSSGRVDRGNA